MSNVTRNRGPQDGPRMGGPVDARSWRYHAAVRNLAFLVCASLLCTVAHTWEEHQHDEPPNNNAPAWTLVGANHAQLFVDMANGTWAREQDLTVGGDILLAGPDNLQPSLEACAASCIAHPLCIAFNWCDKGTCPVDAGGQEVPQNACQLVHQRSAEEGRGVIQLASGNARLGDAGVLVLIDRPDPLAFPDYQLFFAQSLQDVYDIACSASFVQGACVLTEPLPDLIARCDAWQDCQAVVVGPRGWGSVRVPYGMLKGSSTGEALDRTRGNLNPATYTLVKKSQLVGSGGGEGAGLSPGAVAGIVAGALAAAAALGLAIWWVLVLRRRRQRLSAPAQATAMKLSGGSSQTPSSQGPEDIAAAWGKESSEVVGATQKLVSRLLSEAPCPQWGDVIVPRPDVTFVTKDGKAVKLGSGSSASVYRGLLHGGTPCAIKVFPFQDGDAKYFIQEAVALRRLTHPNVVQFLGVSVTEGRGLLLMELMGGGDLARALRGDATREGGRLHSWYNRGHIVALQVAAGLHHLHQQRLVHMDLKPHNVLLARDGTAKIGDCGFSRMLQASHVGSLEGRIGTFNWCAPEVLVGGRASEKSDIYSFGIILWELCTGENPVRGYMAPLWAPQHCPAEVVQLHSRCVHLEPQQRPSAAEVLHGLRAALQSPAPGPAASIKLPRGTLQPCLAAGTSSGCNGNAAAGDCPGDCWGSWGSFELHSGPSRRPVQMAMARVVVDGGLAPACPRSPFDQGDSAVDAAAAADTKVGPPSWGSQPPSPTCMLQQHHHQVLYSSSSTGGDRAGSWGAAAGEPLPASPPLQHSRHSAGATACAPQRAAGAAACGEEPV